MRHGINVTAREDDDHGNGSTALLNLCQFHEGISLKETMRMIINHDAHKVLLSKNKNGNSALSLILGRNNQQNRRTNFAKIIRFLLKYDLINVKSKNTNGKDSFDILFSHCSHREDFIDIFRLLVGPSLYPNPRDGEGKKALLVLCS